MEEVGWRRTSEESEESALAAKRDKIDSLDQTIAALLKQRLELAQEIGQVKAQRNIPVKDSGREQIVLDHVRSVVEDPILSDAVARVYQQLLNESRELQVKEDTQQVPNSKLYFPRVLIIGCGLIGGALARQIKRKSPNTIVIGSDTAAVLDQAMSAGVIDEAEFDCVEAIKKASLIILAAGPRQNIAILRKIAPATKRRQVIVDVTSTKLKICQVATELSLKADFVGGHPFFGSQNSGFENSGDIQIDGKSFVITPTSKSTEMTTRRITHWLEQLGMRVQQCDPQLHDDTVASTSHLIQLLSVALGSMLANGVADRELQERLHMSGPGLLSVARLMASPYQMWSEILEQNNEPICTALLSLEGRLRVMRNAIDGGQMDVIEAQFKAAKRTSENLGP